MLDLPRWTGAVLVADGGNDEFVTFTDILLA